MGRNRMYKTVKCRKDGCGKPSVVRYIPTRNNKAGKGEYRKYLYWVHTDKKSKPIKHYIGRTMEDYQSKTNQKSRNDLFWSKEDEEMYKKRKPKISMPKQEHHESRISLSSTELSNSLLKLGQDWKKLTEKIKQFPSNDVTLDRRLMVSLNQFKRAIDNLDSYIQWLSDAKFTNSIFEWTIIKMNQEYNPIRAKNSTTIDQIRAGFGLPPTGTSHNKMSKKGINKNLKKMNKRIDDLVDSLKGLELLKKIVNDLSLWRDKNSEFPNAIKTQKENVREERRDSAIWRQDAEGIEYPGSYSIDGLRDKNRRDKLHPTK